MEYLSFSPGRRRGAFFVSRRHKVRKCGNPLALCCAVCPKLSTLVHAESDAQRVTGRDSLSLSLSQIAGRRMPLPPDRGSTASVDLISLEQVQQRRLAYLVHVWGGWCARVARGDALPRHQLGVRDLGRI